jgi:hypothetical protein
VTGGQLVPPGNGPFASRQRAEHVFAVFRQDAERGTSGPPGEQLVFTTHQLLAETLTDTIEYYAALGDYDRQLIGRLAGLLDATDIGVVCSWIYRVTGDTYDQDAIPTSGPPAGDPA